MASKVFVDSDMIIEFLLIENLLQIPQVKSLNLTNWM